MPDLAVRPEMEFITTRRPPSAALIACGKVAGGRADLRFPATDLPCYQALGPWGEPDAGLPWFRIGDAERATSGPGTGPDAGALPGLLLRTDWLLLVVGRDHDALALALAIATYARGRGISIMALLPARPALRALQRDALAHRVDYACEYPAGVDPLLAAQALWSSVGCRGQVGVDFSDMAGTLAGQGRMIWSPLREPGADRLASTLAMLPALQARRGLWAVLLLQDGVSMADYRLADQLLRPHCHGDATLIATVPEARSLPDGLFVFTA